ncbi:ABC transporter substrate-binding protein [Roseivivax sp. GX 12232]|uniref:CmpA/NrtA family ABC transporter substrate-binding protein n=1 Tax=Roseivivax sp. GX 12232 TaxID=2900547 RepID=UPI001E356397|nr:CmpA/NrtA family ABC transporter substrate-binding protein [Roseivivax sp. GX 12232]MCE0504700.1 ABC transporter substrate-binding protein [Roseivivax sp. GX 12232]
MRTTPISLGYVPLVDAAPLIVAEEMGFAAAEGLSLDLVQAPSWSRLRDALSVGQVDAAHMLAPVPVATALGLGGGATGFDVVSVLSVNGTMVGLSAPLAEKMRAAGHDFDLMAAERAGRLLISGAPKPLRFGVPFPFSMHAELVFHWLSALGLPSPQSLVVRTVPPPLMADAIQTGEIDAFCVGEPWASQVAAKDGGVLLLAGKAIWSWAPEKVLATRACWADGEPELSARLIRAVWRASRWLEAADARSLAAELLARREYLDVGAELIERAFTGQFDLGGGLGMREVQPFLSFHEGAAHFPWRSQAAWIGSQLAARTGLDRASAMRSAERTFRSDIHRAALAQTSAILPPASSRVEGAFAGDSQVTGVHGVLRSPGNTFFDGARFDPASF